MGSPDAASRARLARTCGRATHSPLRVTLSTPQTATTKGRLATELAGASKAQTPLLVVGSADAKRSAGWTPPAVRSHMPRRPPSFGRPPVHCGPWLIVSTARQARLCNYTRILLLLTCAAQQCNVGMNARSYFRYHKRVVSQQLSRPSAMPRAPAAAAATLRGWTPPSLPLPPA